MSRSFVNLNGTPSASVVSGVAKPPSGPAFSIPKYASAMYISPQFSCETGAPKACHRRVHSSGTGSMMGIKCHPDGQSPPEINTTEAATQEKG
ncbi:hypothetical protein FNV43_RR20341 [Rhamnella rubrinervis]|uniref:Uncharacterized protein n=1 Tax=Rhamnella rubrinervis TaxID=2594499 RepID=A0A8K0DUM3_9ROSA|nr:hypothetical protein FNV43_RR20341 [Rhamnella rubrinervis]